MASRFAEVTQDPVIEVFELTRQFNEDTHPQKVNLGVGCKRLLLNYFLNFCYCCQIILIILVLK
jgi:hypothetical protein